MFCNHCEQSFCGTGCNNNVGICGKDEDVQSVQELILYGLKGMAAYANHARRLGKSDESVSAFIEEALFSTMTNVNFDINALFEIALELGRKNLRVMELLDAGHIEKFGKPEPATVIEGTQAGHGILITGHDLLDLADLLRQLEGTDLKVYTHGEMLPAHMYPKLHKHPNLAGHYGTAWQNQEEEFARFPGPIVATTNCVLIPPAQYAKRIYTTRATAVPGGTRIKDNDFSPVIAQARQCPPCKEHVVGNSQVGFHRQVLLDLAPTIVDAVKGAGGGEEGGGSSAAATGLSRGGIISQTTRKRHRRIHSSSHSAAASFGFATTITANSSACHACSIWASATIPMARFRLPSHSPVHSVAA